jgi:hypothetical protein
MNTFFIRHTHQLSISDETRQKLWDDQLIAIHFPVNCDGSWENNGDNRSLNPADYIGSGKKSMNRLCELARFGGYVCAEYHGKSEILIGKIDPESEISLLEGKWNQGLDRVAVLKTLRLTNTKKISPNSYAVIAASRPRMGTISRWPSVRNAISLLVDGHKPPPSWEMLSTSQQELGCSEFLRLEEISQFGLPRLQALILPFGGTLKDVDIIGIATDTKKIFAQVTFFDFNSARTKLDKLRKFVDPSSAHIILFCKCDTHFKQDDIHIFPVNEVFNALKRHDWGERFLSGD